MLFLGLGTGLGGTLILDGTIEPMELGHMPYKDGKTYEDHVGERRAFLVRFIGRQTLYPGNSRWSSSARHHIILVDKLLAIGEISAPPEPTKAS